MGAAASTCDQNFVPRPWGYFGESSYVLVKYDDRSPVVILRRRIEGLCFLSVSDNMLPLPQSPPPLAGGDVAVASVFDVF